MLLNPPCDPFTEAMRCVKVSTAACTSHTAECFCRMGTDALTYRDDVIARAGERHRQTENV